MRTLFVACNLCKHSKYVGKLLIYCILQVIWRLYFQLIDLRPFSFNSNYHFFYSQFLHQMCYCTWQFLLSKVLGSKEITCHLYTTNIVSQMHFKIIKATEKKNVAIFRKNSALHWHWTGCSLSTTTDSKYISRMSPRLLYESYIEQSSSIVRVDRNFVHVLLKLFSVKLNDTETKFNLKDLRTIF